MNINKIAVYLAGAVSLGCAGVLLADQGAQSDTSPKSSQSYESSKYKAASDTTTQSQSPSEFNKASKLVGMDVRNEAGEKIGDIKDLVIDPQSGKVSYAVMKAGGVLGVGEKLLAIPLTAFSQDQAKKCLMLNASKDSIKNAESIGDNWPAVQDPSFGAQPFWQKNGESPSKKAD